MSHFVHKFVSNDVGPAQLIREQIEFLLNDSNVDQAL